MVSQSVPDVPPLSEENLRLWQLAAKTESLECPSLDDPPPSWVDKDKFRRGQEFVQKYRGIVGVSYAAAACLVFVVDTIFKVFVNNRKCEKIPKCLQHLLSIKNHVMSWHDSDIWDPTSPAYNSMIEVQGIHKRVGTYCNENLDKMSTIAPNHKFEPRVYQDCTLWSHVREDAKRFNPSVVFELPEDASFMSQFDTMTGVFGLIGPLLVNRERVGLHGVPEKELEDFVYMWRVLAYYLGVKDKFNPFGKDVKELRQLAWQYYYSVTIPAFYRMTKENEFHFRMSVESSIQMFSALSPTLPRPEVVFLLMTPFDSGCFPSCYNSLSFISKVKLFLIQFTFAVIMRVYLIRKIVNYILSLYA